MMSIVGELEQVLAEEQQLLLSGTYDQLEILAEKKSRLAERLAEGAPDLKAKDYERILERATHNEALLGSAQRGIQAAMTQLRQISEGEHQSTYSKEGERKPLARMVSVTQKF